MIWARAFNLGAAAEVHSGARRGPPGPREPCLCCQWWVCGLDCYLDLGWPSHTVAGPILSRPLVAYRQP